MKKTQIILQSTSKGFTEDVLWKCLLIVGCAFIYFKVPIWLKEEVLVTLCQWSLILIAFACVYRIIYIFNYENLSKVVLVLDENEKIVEIKTLEIGFPYNKQTENHSCNRILGVTVYQSTINRLLNTGHISLEFTTFVNAGTDTHEFYCYAIPFPESVKDEILACSPQHDGIKITQ